MLTEIGNLKHYWHVIALSSEIQRGQSLKRSLYGHPFLVWRDHGNALHAMTDCCAHRRAPLKVRDYHKNQIVCPYHGWEYNAQGDLVHVPSDPDAASRLNCSIDPFPMQDADGFVWISLDGNEPKYPRPDLSNYQGAKGWKANFKSQLFHTTEELLVDNFMDPTHTALVHNGVIRNQGQETDHHVVVSSHQKGVKVEFAETEESVGVGARFLFGRSMKVKHSDEFLLPNLVRVIYEINQVERFIALIACSPLEQPQAGKTMAFVQLRYRFGWITPLAGPILSILANKVLRQDEEITRHQFLNQQRFAHRSEHLVAVDSIAQSVVKLRQAVANSQPLPGDSQRSLRLRF